MEMNRFLSASMLLRFCLVMFVLSATCQSEADTKSNTSEEFLNTLDKIFLENREGRINDRDDVPEDAKPDSYNPKDVSTPNVKTVYFRSLPPSTRAQVESDLINYFSENRNKVQMTDLEENQEFAALNSSQKGQMLRLMPDIDILKIHGTNMKGVKLNEGTVFRGDQINKDVDVVFKDQVINRRMDSEEMNSLDNDTDFKEILLDNNKTDCVIIWTRMANMERMMQMATNGNSTAEWNVAQNALFEGDIQLNSTQAKDIEDSVVNQIWDGSLTADYLATHTGLNSTILQPMVKKAIRIENPIIDEAAKLLTEVDIPDTTARTAIQTDDIEDLLQDPDMRINILQMVKAKRMDKNTKLRLDTSEAGDFIPSVEKSGLDSQAEENVQEENAVTDEQLNAMLRNIIEEEKKYGLSAHNVTGDGGGDIQVKYNHLKRILNEVLQETMAQEYDDLNQKKRDLAHAFEKRKMRDSGKWATRIRYRFLSGFSTAQKNAVKQGLHHWESETCFRFNEGGISGPHFKFEKITDKNICGSSYVGKQSSGNLIRIQTSCFNTGVIAHEVGHSLGLWHEHSRPDRDDYVTILWDNIGYGRSNFNKKSWADTITYRIPYDYGSAMHYSSKAFGSGKTTITAKDSRINDVMGQRKSLSFWDFKLANFHYCSDACPNQRTLEWYYCRNNGYRDPNHCNQCKCADGYRGTYCQDYDTDTKTCGTTSNRATVTPKYISATSSISRGQNCVWTVYSYSSRYQLRTQLTEYNLPGSCSSAYLELRSGDLRINGPRYCGSGSWKYYNSLGSKLMIILHSGVSSSSKFRLKYWLSPCGMSDNRYSPSPACMRTYAYSCSQKYTIKCGILGLSRCTRYRNATCTSVSRRCYRGVLSGSYCRVSLCGGCKDKYVMNQPACRQNVTKTRLKRVKYYTNCGFLGWSRCARYKYVVETYVYKSFYSCCSGYKVSGSRCTK